MKNSFSFFLLIILLSYAMIGRAQSPQSGGKKLINRADTFFSVMPSEKLYLHTDKPYYNVTDTIWFKAYALNAALFPSRQSAKVYVELINDSSKLVKRVIIPVQDGLGNGDILLDKTIPPGTYTMRAYTNWMQNFGTGLFFSKLLYIGGAGANNMILINEQHEIKQTANDAQVNLSLNLSNAKKMALPFHDVEVVITAAGKRILNKKFTTTDAGKLNTSFTIDNAVLKGGLQLTVTDKNTRIRQTLPIIIDADANIDLQFFPEGGNMVAGIYNKVAFKAINTTGYGEDISGEVKNSKNEVVARITSLHNGMGSFMLLPQPGNKYYAALRTASGKTFKAELPAVRPAGTALRIDNLSKPDSISLYITAMLDTALLKRHYTLIAEIKDQVVFATPVDISRGFFNLKIPANKFGTGIAAFTLLDENDKPLNQRRIFIDRHNNLSVSLNTNKPAFNPKDSVALAFTVTNELGEPVKGFFSATVTADDYIKTDINDNDIRSQMLLTSEMTGYIESPGWYFNTAEASARKALDNLLLTQGWTGYDWALSPAPSKPKFEAETDNHVAGKLENLFKKPIKGAKVTLFASSKKNGLVAIDTTSNELGRFVFNDLPFFDTIAYTIKVHNKKGKEMGAGIIVDEFTPANVALSDNVPVSKPWFAGSSDSLMVKYFNKPAPDAPLNQQPLSFKNRQLKEVTIRAKKEPVNMGFVNNFEYGHPIRELNEAELIKAKKRSLLSLVREKFKNFREASYYADDAMNRAYIHRGIDELKKPFVMTNFVLGTRYIYDVYIDDRSVQSIYGNRLTGDSTTYRKFIIYFLETMGADDVKEVKILEGLHTFMTITTRSGAGPFAISAPGTLAYRPLPITLPRDFYKPKYTVTTSPIIDTRTTVNWEPNIITDDEGKAKIWFYAADKPDTYTLKLEGTDLQGHVASQTFKINIEAKTIN
ncbi:hypothetical protein [Mucilaginibacter sp. AK015]|uniref:hypothetical protein n=1 Tax=Mucilaginibacter sp. AK015 TaxID=2723072 RepID=UPI00161FAB9C|nr:hypothetical protein [Mucilaginibacter sp. AK015]MBB5395429.1 hypothetical protein [Mucilaginibacter sp. AK015]